jgi:hypothetical protein
MKYLFLLLVLVLQLQASGNGYKNGVPKESNAQNELTPENQNRSACSYSLLWYNEITF